MRSKLVAITAFTPCNRTPLHGQTGQHCTTGTGTQGHLLGCPVARAAGPIHGTTEDNRVLLRLEVAFGNLVHGQHLPPQTVGSMTSQAYSALITSCVGMCLVLGPALSVNLFTKRVLAKVPRTITYIQSDEPASHNQQAQTNLIVAPS